MLPKTKQQKYRVPSVTNEVKNKLLHSKYSWSRLLTYENRAKNVTSKKISPTSSINLLSKVKSYRTSRSLSRIKLNKCPMKQRTFQESCGIQTNDPIKICYLDPLKTIPTEAISMKKFNLNDFLKYLLHSKKKPFICGKQRSNTARQYESERCNY